jgi:hypothetical protein
MSAGNKMPASPRRPTEFRVPPSPPRQRSAATQRPAGGQPECQWPGLRAVTAWSGNTVENLKSPADPCMEFKLGNFATYSASIQGGSDGQNLKKFVTRPGLLRVSAGRQSEPRPGAWAPAAPQAPTGGFPMTVTDNLNHDLTPGYSYRGRLMHGRRSLRT